MRGECDQIWNKALVNSTYNPICTLSRVRISHVIDNPASRELFGVSLTRLER